MTPHAKHYLLRGLRGRGITFEERETELAVLCPECSSLHRSRRLTLYINHDGSARCAYCRASHDCHWICFRCHSKGTTLGALLDFLGLASFQSVELAETDAAALKRRLMSEFNSLGAGASLPIAEVELPAGFRTDWDATITGRDVRTYLLRRGLTCADLERYGVGYTVEQNLYGCAVFPVTKDGKLLFWQARRAVIQTEPKYISPKLPRRGLLYGYDQLDSKSVVLVEGILDALRLRQGGVCALALLGNTISEQQIALLGAKGVRSVAVMLDGEAWAESRAAAQVIAARLWTAREVKALRLPFGVDPGSAGAKSFQLVQETVSFL